MHLLSYNTLTNLHYMATFDRLLKLARKTGDRLIVFDSHTGEGFAAIPIDEYEDMVCHPRDVTALSGDQLIEQINKDIGTWRESQEDEEDMYDMFGSSERLSGSWQSAGDVLHDRYRFDNEYDGEEEDGDEEWFDIAREHITEKTDPYSFLDDEEEALHPNISFDFPSEEDIAHTQVDTNFFVNKHTPEPHIVDVPHQISLRETPREGMWKEESLDEDPIFFEEPVS